MTGVWDLEIDVTINKQVECNKTITGQGFWDVNLFREEPYYHLQRDGLQSGRDLRNSAGTHP